MERGLVQFVASDMHDTSRRPPMLGEAYAVLEQRFGEARVRPLFIDHPRAVIEGEAIDVELPRAVPKRRWRLW